MKAKAWPVILTILVLLSLALNVFCLLTLAQARSAVAAVLASARNALATLGAESITTQVRVDQEIPFNTTVPISQTLTIPLNMEYPLSTVVNTYVTIPLMGRQEIAIPIEAVIPIHYTFDVPIQVEVPISLTYRLQTEIPVTVEIPPELRAPLDQWLEEAQNQFGP